jgi:defect-in-organelle-trafficking protein DotA
MKNKLIFFTPFLLTLLLPELAFAADSGSSINFQPPAQDFSIVFLSNIFGVVDGVLHGTGSQIIGNMFGVFNSAVLTLGGIVAVYTLLVSTMNTAHEGEMLGKKWSSVWIPVRTVFGISLMLPKATGYCMLQVVTMWIVVQGVGAADKVWDAALDYLQRGGVIIQPNINPAATSSGASGTILQGAAGMLAGQVCMLGMQKLLSNIHDAAVSDTTDTSSICFKRAGESDYSSADLQQFCNNGVPDFISTINLSTAKPKSNVYSMEMPNFTSKNKLYSALNGACGTIKWKGLSSGQVSALQNQLTSSEMDSSKKARTIAMQQMFNTLTSVAQSMVNNDPQLNTTLTCSKDSPCASAHPENEALSIAKDPLGVAVTIDGGECQAKNNCKAWGNNPVETTGQDGTVLLTGQELQGAVQDYYGLMLATLNAAEGGVACVSASKAGGAGTNILGQSEGNSCDTKAFMAQARSQGWLMAGAYFFKLAALNTVSAGAIGGSSAESAGVSVNAEGGGGAI